MLPSTSTNEPPEPVFYVDENLGYRFLRTLRERHLQVRYGAEDNRGAADVVWIPAVANSGWVVVTKDQFREDSGARDAMLRHGSKVVVLIGEAAEPDLAALFLRKEKWIRNQVKCHTAGFVAKIYTSGRATVLTLETFCARPGRFANRR